MNATINAMTDVCRSWKVGQDGKLKDYNISHCVELGFSHSNYIMECRGDYKDERNCGTFIELHFPKSVFDPRQIYAEKKMKGGIFTGYHSLPEGMMVTYLGDNKKVLCIGDYELWWVQRTRRFSYVIAKKKFAITWPQCDWNIDGQYYEEYATVAIHRREPGGKMPPGSRGPVFDEQTKRLNKETFKGYFADEPPPKKKKPEY